MQVTLDDGGTVDNLDAESFSWTVSVLALATPIGDLLASQEKSRNGADGADEDQAPVDATVAGTDRVAVTGRATAAIQSTMMWAGTGIPAAPADSTTAVAAGWTLVSGNFANGAMDEPASRDFWSTSPSCTMAAACLAVSNRTGGTLNYHLGDVYNGTTPGAGDSQVLLNDVNQLGAHYGTTEALIRPSTGIGWTSARPLTTA